MKKLPILRTFLAAIGLVSVSSAADFPTYRVRAHSIVDGDSGVFVITEGPKTGTKVAVRLAGVDAPEIKKTRRAPGQPLGLEAKSLFEEMTGQRPMRLTVVRREAKQVVGVLDYWIMDQKVVLNAELVRAGMADVFEPTLVSIPVEERAQIDSAHFEAETAKKGIWSLAKRERPIDYRKRLAAD